MSKKYLQLFLILLSVFAFSCNRNAGVVREIHYADLLNPKNRPFHKYPDEFSTYLLKGILKDELKAFHIDYDSTGQIVPLNKTIFIQRILEPYSDYDQGEFTITDEYTMEDVNDLLSSVTLLGFDDLVIDGESSTGYINFYHPADITPEGLNKYICSIEYGSAMEYLFNARKPLLWHNYKLADWGWFNNKLFIPQLQTSSQLAFDMITMTDTSILHSRLTGTESVDEIMETAEGNPFYLISKFIPENEKLLVSYYNDSVFVELARFTYDDILKVAELKNTEDSVRIVPIGTAILEGGLDLEDRVKKISENGEFLNPLNGKDRISNQQSGSSNIDPMEFPDDEKFTFRTIDRLIGSNPVKLDQLPQLLYEGVRQGDITVYQADSLKNRLLPGGFFDRLIIDDQDNLLANPADIQVYQLITETIFLKEGNIISHKPVGIALFLPGKLVPEGLNRPIGFFRIDDVNEYLQTLNKDTIPFSQLSGYPLKSWNVEVIPK